MEFYQLSKEFQDIRIPFIDFQIPAGFPSPAADYIETRIDISTHLIKNPSFTFFAKATGNSMEPSIGDGDLIVIDKKVSQPNGCVVVVSIDNEFCIRRLFRFADGSIELRSDNPKYKPIHLSSEFEGGFEIFGTVIWSIEDHRICKQSR